MKYRSDMTPAQRQQWQRYCMRRTLAFPDADWYDRCFENDNGSRLKLCAARRFALNWRRSPAAAENICIWGKAGCGRHFFAGCIANELLDAGADVLVTRFDALLEELAEADRSFLGKWAELQRHDLLILDLSGMGRLPTSALGRLQELLSRCGRFRQRMLLLLDGPPHTLAEGDSLLQRRLEHLLDGWQLLDYNTPDYSSAEVRTELWLDYEQKKRSVS